MIAGKFERRVIADGRLLLADRRPRSAFRVHARLLGVVESDHMARALAFALNNTTQQTIESVLGAGAGHSDFPGLLRRPERFPFSV